MDVPADPLAPLIDALHAEGRPRVWSLVITVFGDSVQPRGGRIATTRLQRLLGRIGVEPGALRTALSRLRRDGWVMAEREGRFSLYRLSESGLARFAPATERIYAPPREGEVHRWTLALGGAGAQGIPVAPSLRLIPEAEAGDADLAVTGALSALAPGFAEALLPEPHRAALAALAADLAALEGLALGPLDAAAARTLLIHRWRRLVLRWPELPPVLLPQEAPRDPRAAVARAWRALTPKAEAWLDSADARMPAMPPAGAALARRFAQAS
ncbi:hypothetical protein DRV85_07410 [Rhodosalinus halophilus]|uniref:Transcriptional regulator, PaaX family n=1 Tax=Rhodosalinus halophilus TaxID=2259333 RepID=A0A365U9B6_9RHOB|nr:PaaX family transcriptional regulator C-terminal domain-containing protein [Rhodosalinus halophilus]RBI85559.1 hypothetical protein DRV85_07410 [Rhodosalinus halophilus]